MKNIEIEALSVKIKTIKIDSKKMTLSVFKQLPEKNIINENLELQGIVWGRVNYQIPKQPVYETNIVWQHGNNLYRSAIRRLFCTPEEGKRYHSNGESLYGILPHRTLINAIEETPEEKIKTLSELFEKYKKIYKELVNSDQLYISV